MSEYLQVVYSSVTELSSHEVIKGLLFGFALAVVASAACNLVRKRVSDSFAMVCGLIMLVSAISMATGVAHSHYKSVPAWKPLVASDPAAGYRVVLPPIGQRLLEDADTDEDGRLTPDEAARFVKKADKAGKGWADVLDIDRARREWIAPRSIQDFHPDTARLFHQRQGF